MPTLKALHESQYDLLAVVTQPDRPKGRGRRLVSPPVRDVAGRLGYPVLQPARIDEPLLIDKITAFNPDLFVVVAYGRILPAAFLAIPHLGAINIHPSLLPKYRGPAPIQWAIINGDQETGVTTMWLDEGMDTGDILLNTKVPIKPEDTFGSLQSRLAEVGAELLIETIARIKSENLMGKPQDNALATYAPLLKKENGRIDWSGDAASLDAMIRGMNPWPGAFTSLFGKRLKVLKAEEIQKQAKEKPGTVLEGFPGDFNVATGRGILALKQVQLESAKRLMVNDFLRGCPVPPGTVLG